MPSPKSGNAGSLVSPTEPQKAIEADNAIPGSKVDPKRNGGSETDTSKPHKPKENPDKKSWIEIEMVDEEEKPVVGLAYRITLPDGETIASGTLDDKGFARVSAIDPGNCKVTFPTLDQEAWEAL